MLHQPKAALRLIQKRCFFSLIGLIITTTIYWACIFGPSSSFTTPEFSVESKLIFHINETNTVKQHSSNSMNSSYKTFHETNSNPLPVPIEAAYSIMTTESTTLPHLENRHTDMSLYNATVEPDDSCLNNTYLLICTISAPTSISQREIYRMTVLSPLINGSLSDVRHVFLLGLSNDIDLNKRILLEANEHKDIVIGNFLDSFDNLTLKSLFLINWASRRCPNTKYIYKLDDDVFAYIASILADLKSSPYYEYRALGRLLKLTVPIRDESNKRHADSYYKEQIYPSFLSGPSYIISTPLLGPIFNTSLKLPMLRLEDVFITGICAKATNLPIEYVNIPGFNFNFKWEHAADMSKLKSIHGLNAQQLLAMWKRQPRAAHTTNTEEVLDVDIRRPVKTLEKKIIYSASKDWMDLDKVDFSPCLYNNCQMKVGKDVEDMKDGCMLLFQSNFIPKSLKDDLQERQNQLWVIYSHESPRMWPYLWDSTQTTNRFNLTMTYRPDSDITIPFGRINRITTPITGIQINYAANKTKGAYAYITNCGSVGYDRMGLMLKLKEYIDVDIYGKCTYNQPCQRLDFKCEDNLHWQYRFYLSFENSLCKDYITEKFWYRLSSRGILLPIAIGALSLEEYNKVAPPDSFLHVYNFTSVAKLGEYLKYLMENDEAYNKYHEWRQYFMIERHNFCELCKIANENKSRPAHNNLSDWWNKDICKTFNFPQE